MISGEEHKTAKHILNNTNLYTYTHTLNGRKMVENNCFHVN